jgi:dipeptidase D
MTMPTHFPTSPTHIWGQFYNITQCPRPSKKEEKIREYIVGVAQQKNLEHVVDRAGNVIIYVPATKGYEAKEPVIIQNHMDMVTDAIVGKTFDFNVDPIETLVEDGWLKADGTTLGADNGIGCAAALAVLFEEDIEHPSLELLFTTDEETGLNGALGLESNYLKGTRMLNLDTEEWGSLYIGCAGGIDYELSGQVNQQDYSGGVVYKVEIKGLVGGHSGVEIHEQRGNAIKLLAQFLNETQSEHSFRLLEMRAGRAHNIIPREAFAYIAFDSEVDLSEKTQTILQSWRSFLPSNDQQVELVASVTDQSFTKELNTSDTQKVLSLITLFPHGVKTYDLATNREIVSMSNNLAKVLVMNGHVYFLTSLRFFDREEVKQIEGELRSLAQLFGFELKHNSEYPSWKPERENKLLDQVGHVYQDQFGNKPVVTAIHAGLECGILRDKIGPIDVVSFGPTIKGAHSPDEALKIDTVTHFWNFFKSILKNI